MLEDGGYTGSGRMESVLQKRQSVSQSTHAASRRKEEDKVCCLFFSLVMTHVYVSCAPHSIQIKTNHIKSNQHITVQCNKVECN